MKPHYQDESVTLYAGDCLDVLRELPEADPARPDAGAVVDSSATTTRAVGICGDPAVRLVGIGAGAPAVCTLLAGHPGWHSDDNGARWSHGTSDALDLLTADLAAARSALARVEALRDHYAEIGQQAFTRDGTIHAFTDVADDLSEALGDEPSAYRAALAPSPAEPGSPT